MNSIRPGLRLLAAIALALVVFNAVVSGQDVVGQPKWGFAGTSVLHRFNLLTVSLHNPTEQPMDKQLRLSRVLGGLRRGAPILRRVYLGPKTTKTVRLHPFLVSAQDRFELSWVEGGPTTSIPAPRADLLATVMLLDSELVGEQRIALRSVSPGFLPGRAEELATLRALVVDETPVLASAQTRALLTWLRGGGEIHLLRRSGVHPRFGAGLEILNTKERLVTYGNGRIFRHDFSRIRLRDGVPWEISPYTSQPFLPFQADTTNDMRGNLKPAVELQYGWGWIFLMAFAYLLLIGPVFYRLSTQRLSWPWGLASLSGIVALATLVFTVVGSRNAGELDRTTSFTYAVPLADADYQITQFANLFVAQGGDVRVGDDRYALFSSGQNSESIRGEIHNGSKGHYVLDMPRFSNRLIIRQGVSSGPPAAIRFDQETFTTDLSLDRVWSVNRNLVYSWRVYGGTWRRQKSMSIPVFLSQFSDQPDSRLELAMIEQLQMARSDPVRGLTDEYHHVVFCRGPTPAGFQLPGTGPTAPIAAATGIVVYRFDRVLNQR